jgi:hypothetical protein
MNKYIKVKNYKTNTKFDLLPLGDYFGIKVPDNNLEGLLVNILIPTTIVTGNVVIPNTLSPVSVLILKNLIDTGSIIDTGEKFNLPVGKQL